MRRPFDVRHLVLLAVLVTALGAGAIPEGVDRVEYEKAARTILCDCGCHPQSVYDCTCGRAAEMREEVATEIRKGMTGEAVVASYVAEHGEQIRIAPTASGFNLVAWVGPGLVLVLVGLGMILLLRRWRRRQPVDEPAPVQSASDDEYRDRLRTALEEYDV